MKPKTHPLTWAKQKAVEEFKIGFRRGLAEDMKPTTPAVGGAAPFSAKCATCKLFERAFPLNYQLGYCKGIQIDRLDGGGIAISRRIYEWTPGDEALRLMDDFGCAYHSPNTEIRRGEPDATNKPVGESPSPASNG